MLKLKTEKKKGKFNLYNIIFNPAKEGKGVKKEPVGPKNLINFFKLFGRSFSKIVGVNMLFIFGNFPIIFMLLAKAGYFSKTSFAPASMLFSAVHSATLNSPSPYTSALFGIFGFQGQITVNTTVTYILYGLSLLTILTFGLVNVGTTYILKLLVKGEPIFMMSDFKYAIKRNFKQGMIMGILDVVFMFVIGFDISYFFSNIGTYANNLVFYASILLALVYLVMRFYIYNIMITFDLSIYKILKNSLIFSVVGLKRNIMALIGIAFLAALNVFLLGLYFPLGMIFPFILLFGAGAFMGTYASYPKIEEIMITPYLDEKEEEENEEEPIFVD